MWLGLGKPVLSSRKIWPDFESLKCNNFICNKYCIQNVIIYAEIHEEFNKTNSFWIAYTE